MGAFEFTVRAAVQDYHIYKDTWTLTIDEEFVCSQELANEHDVHAIAVYGDGEMRELGTIQDNCYMLHTSFWTAV